MRLTIVVLPALSRPLGRISIDCVIVYMARTVAGSASPCPSAAPFLASTTFSRCLTINHYCIKLEQADAASVTTCALSINIAVVWCYFTIKKFALFAASHVKKYCMTHGGSRCGSMFGACRRQMTSPTVDVSNSCRASSTSIRS